MSARGFTLVEMLVALLVFALLSAVGVTVMAYAADNQGVVQARMDRLGEFQRARALLKAGAAAVDLCVIARVQEAANLTT